MNPQIASRMDLAGLTEAIAAEPSDGRVDVELSDAVLHSEGWENVVLETKDGWILRFPRDEGVPFEREVAILARLAGRLPAPIPEIAWTGTRTRFAAYRKLSGWSFDPSIWNSASTRQRNEFAAGLARFLVAMHTAFDDEEVTELGIPEGDRKVPLDKVRAGMDRIPGEFRTRVENVADSYAESWAAGLVPGPITVLHNDFHLGNMVFTEPLGGPSGVWDFSCVELGLPTADLRYFVDEPADLFERLVAEYQRISGWEIDAKAAESAAMMEDICDFLETGRLAELERRSWPT